MKRDVSVDNLPHLGSEVVDHAVDELGGQMSDLTGKLRSHLPDFYAVGLWGYCEGTGNKYTECTSPNASFSFNLVQILESKVPGVADLLPATARTTLSGYDHPSEWAISGYIIGLIATALAVVAGMGSVLFPWGIMLTSLCSFVGLTSELMVLNTDPCQAASVFTIGASIAVTVIYSLTVAGAQASLKNIGVSCELGAGMMALMWLASGLSLLSSLLYIMRVCCCCL